MVFWGCATVNKPICKQKRDRTVEQYNSSRIKEQEVETIEPGHSIVYLAIHCLVCVYNFNLNEIFIEDFFLCQLLTLLKPFTRTFADISL